MRRPLSPVAKGVDAGARKTNFIPQASSDEDDEDEDEGEDVGDDGETVDDAGGSVVSVACALLCGVWRCVAGTHRLCVPRRPTRPVVIGAELAKPRLLPKVLFRDTRVAVLGGRQLPRRG